MVFAFLEYKKAVIKFLDNSNATVKPVVNSHSKRTPKLVFNTDYHLMQVTSIAECSKGAFCNTFYLY